MVEKIVAVQPTEAELIAQMQVALKSGDYKAVAKVSSEIVKLQKGKESAENEAKVKELAGKTEKVKSVIDKAVQKMIDSGELDKADGIWYTNDFGEKLTACRLMKSQTKVRASGGGGGKKFDVNTVELLNTKYAEQPYKDTGMNFKQAWDSNTDKNWRFGIRKAILKGEGLIQ